MTGASSGIGAAVTQLLADHGCQVLGLSRRPAKCDSKLVSSLEVDLSKLSQLEQNLESLKELAVIDGVILSHGYGDFGALEQFSSQRIRKLIDTNLTSCILLSRLFLPILKTQGHGTLVLIGSESALRGGRQGAVYSATKFALRGLAQSLRQEASTAGVRVLLVNPGMVDTPFFDELHFGPGDDVNNALEAEDVAEAVFHGLTAPSHAVVDEINLSPLKHVVRSQSDR
ncbi:MAG: SDR family oxidoreductase [Acidiferrobacterales bacterium]|nr:SDR family oxidoreductase [Acidiferrobacterales bacterium]